MFAPISVPAALRGELLDESTTGATLSFALMMGLRASSGFAFAANVPNAGFFVLLR